MQNTLTPDTTCEQRLEWAEPEIHELHLRETAMQGGMGGDGGAFSDCTRS